MNNKHKIPMLGHNGGPPLDDDDFDPDFDDPIEIGGVAGKRLLAFFERIERLEEEKAGLAEDIKEVFSEAKGVGFDVKTMRRLLKLRKMDAEKRYEEQEMLDLYMSAVGMK